MNRKIHLPVLLGIAGFLAVPASALALSVGDTAPDFKLTSSQGDEVSLNDFSGKTVVLEWTNHKCPFVRKHYRSDNMQKQQRIADQQEIVWLSIISSAPGKQGHVSPEKAEQIAKDYDASPHRILLDDSGETGKAYRAKTTPHMYIVDGEGKLRYQGAIDSNDSADRDDIKDAQQYVLAAFDAMKADQKIDPDTTVPYGCSIKY